MAIAPHIKEMMNSKGASVIRRMFEEGALLKKEFGADKVYDFSIGNPDLEPPEELKAAIGFREHDSSPRQDLCQK